MRKMSTNVTITKIFGKQMIFDHRYYVAEELKNGKQIRVSNGFAFQADAESLAREMWKRDHGRGGKFVVIVAD